MTYTEGRLKPSKMVGMSPDELKVSSLLYVLLGIGSLLLFRHDWHIVAALWSVHISRIGGSLHLVEQSKESCKVFLNLLNTR